MKTLLLGAALVLSSQAFAADPDLIAKGQENMFHKAYQGAPFIPDVAIYDNLWQSWEPELKAIAEMATPEERRHMMFDRYGWVEAPYENDGMPMGLQKKADGTVYASCLLCHGGSVYGKPVAGAPGNRLNFTTMNEDVVLTMLAMSGQEVPPRPFPLGWLSLSAGTTNAFTFSANFLSFRDKDMNQIETPVGMGAMKGSDLDAPAWWNVAKKKWLYSDGFVVKGPRSLMQFSLDPGVTGEQFRDWLPDYEAMLAWIESLEAPKYEDQIGAPDPDLVAAGRDVFKVSCKGCHGTYEAGEESYPNLTVSLSRIQTDPDRVQGGLTPEFRAYYGQSWLAEYNPANVVVEPRGYVAPHLGGVWATAPYFHNGSVPTLYDVLHPATRPGIWKINDPNKYDVEKGGLDIAVVDKVPADVPFFEQRRYVDTTQPSKGNGGHTFVNALTEPQKRAVLEYLKTL